MPDRADEALPKWPRVRVTGERVSAEQASEIVRRTDVFLVTGHGRWHGDRRWEEWAAGLLAMPRTWAVLHGADTERRLCVVRPGGPQDAWLAEWGAVGTRYVYNDWLVGAYGARRGWCHPSGEIGFDGEVAKKWPTAAEFLDEWRALASTFPFLSVGATLWNRDESRPLVGVVARDGLAGLVDPAVVDVHAGHPPVSSTSVSRQDASDWVKQWAARRGVG